MFPEKRKERILHLVMIHKFQYLSVLGLCESGRCSGKREPGCISTHITSN